MTSSERPKGLTAEQTALERHINSHLPSRIPKPFFMIGHHHPRSRDYYSNKQVITGEISTGGGDPVNYIARQALGGENLSPELDRPPSIPRNSPEDTDSEEDSDDDSGPPAQRQFSLPSVGIGGNLDHAEINAEKEAREESSIPLIAIDTFGSTRLGEKQKEVANLSGPVIGLGYYVLLSRVAMLSSQGNLVKMSRRGFFGEMAGLIGAGVGLYGLNHLALNKDYPRMTYNHNIGHLSHQFVAGFPAEMLQHIDPESYFAFQSNLHWRNQNMAYNLYPTLVAVSHARGLLENGDKVMIRSGLLHSDLKHQFLRGHEALEESLSESMLRVLDYYTSVLAQVDNEDEYYRKMTDLMHVCKTFSTPVSDIFLDVPSDIKLPKSGLVLLWQTMSQLRHFYRNRRLPEKLAHLSNISRCLLEMNYQVNRTLGRRSINRNNGGARGHFGYTNIHHLDLGEFFEIYVPENLRDYQINTAIIVQNNTPYFLRLVAIGINRYELRIFDNGSPIGIYSNLADPQWEFNRHQPEEVFQYWV